MVLCYPCVLQAFGYGLLHKIAIGAIGVFLECFDHFGFEGVLFDVTHQGIEIGFVSDIPRLESSLPEVSCAFVFFIEVDGIVHVELSHEFREVVVRGLASDSSCAE